MSKLVAKQGAILAESAFNADTFTVRFRNKASTTGDLGEVEIGREGELIRLTYAQAISLANEIMRRCQRCGRPKAVYRKFGLCRICLRVMVHAGEVPGVTKASW